MISIKTGISTACFYPMHTEDSLDIISRLGIADIEVFLNSDCEFHPDYIKTLKEKAERLHLNVVSVHPHTSAMETLMFFSAYDRRVRDGMRLYDRFFGMAGLLGAKYFTFHGERTLMHPLNAEKAGVESKAGIYKELCALARSHGVVLTQENVAWCRSADPEYISVLRKAVPELRFTLDIKQARRAKTPIERYVRAMGSALKNIHINDYNETETCLLPGDGRMDYEKFFTLVKSTGYEGHCLIEVYSDNYANLDQIAASENHIKGLIADSETRIVEICQ